MSEAKSKSETPSRSQEPTADRVISGLHSVDRRVDDMRKNRASDPDSLPDKLLKLFAPVIVGLIAGRAFQVLWNKGLTRHSEGIGQEDKNGEQGLVMSLLFAALSAAFGAVVSQLSSRGSQAFVEHRHRRREQGQR